jgi:hypothetical protein
MMAKYNMMLIPLMVKLVICSTLNLDTILFFFIKAKRKRESKKRGASSALS